MRHAGCWLGATLVLALGARAHGCGRSLSLCRWALLRRVLKFGGPSGFQLFFETIAFTAFLFLMGRLGQTALAATTIAFSVNSFAFVPILGLGIAVTTLVGQQLGRNDPPLAERATWVAFLLGGLYVGTMALLYLR